MPKPSKWRKRQLTALLVFLLAFFLFGALAWNFQGKREAAVTAITQSEAFQKAQARAATRKDFVQKNREQQVGRQPTAATNETVPSQTETGPFEFQRFIRLLEKEEWKWWFNQSPSSFFWALSAEDKARVVQLLQENQNLLAEIRALAAAGLADYELDLNFSIENYSTDTHWGAMVQFSRLLAAQCAYELEEGKTAEAFENVRALYQLAEILAGETLHTSQTVRAGIHWAGFETLQRFPSGSLTAAQWGELSALLASPDFTTDFSDSWYVSANQAMEAFQHVREGGSMPGEEAKGSWVMTLYGSPLARPLLNLDETHCCQTMARCAALARLPFYEALPQLDALESERESLLLVQVLYRTSNSYFLSIFQSQADAIAHSQLAQAALQLERYHEQHGVYPATLAEAGVVSLDPFSGDPYIYQPGEEDFRVYSIGRNRQDDQGRNDLVAGDLVWQSVASRNIDSQSVDPAQDINATQIKNTALLGNDPNVLTVNAIQR